MARKFLTPIDLSGLELTNFKIHNLSTDPTPKGKGHAYYNTSDNVLKVYNGSSWEAVGGAVAYGTASQRPNAAKAGRLFVDTDGNDIYFDNGTSWVKVGDTYTDEQAVSAITAVLGNGLDYTGTIDINTGFVKDAIGNALAPNGGLVYDNTNNFSVDTSLIATVEYVDQQITNSGISAGDGIDVTGGTVSVKYDNDGIVLDGNGSLSLAANVIRESGGWFEIRQIDFTQKATFGSSGVVTDDSINNAFAIRSNPTFDLNIASGSSLNLLGNQNINLTTQNGDIVLNPDGSAYLFNAASSDNLIATQGWVNMQGFITDISGKQDAFTVGTNLTLTDGVLDLAYPMTGTGLKLDNAGALAVDTNIIATKAYVDATAQGLDVKASVLYATIVGDDPFNTGTIDGQAIVSLTDGARVLVKDSTDTSQNGIYRIANDGIIAQLIRADDALVGGGGGPVTLSKGAFTFVESGTNAGKGFVVSTFETAPSTTIVWTQFSETGNYITSVGSNLSVSGGQLSVDLSSKQDALTFGTGLALSGSTLSVDWADPTITGTLTLDGSGAFDISSDNDIVLTPGSGKKVYLGSATTGNDLVKSSDLSSYVTSSSLTTTLGDYVTSSSLTSTLGSYVTSSSLSSTLSGYATSSDLSDGLSGKQDVLTFGTNLNYNSGTQELSVNAGNVASSIVGTGLTYNMALSVIDIDTTVVATQSDLSDAVTGMAKKYTETINVDATTNDYYVSHGLGSDVSVQVFLNDLAVELDVERVLHTGAPAVKLSVADPSIFAIGDQLKVVVIG